MSLDTAPLPTPLAPAVALGELLYAVELPPPLSVNNLFHGTGKYPGTGRKAPPRAKTKSYQVWLRNAGQMLVAQGRRPMLSGPVAVVFTAGEAGRSCKFDGDNAFKAWLDLLVRHRIIPDDNRSVVRHLSLTWAPGPRCCVHVFSWQEATP